MEIDELEERPLRSAQRTPCAAALTPELMRRRSEASGPREVCTQTHPTTTSHGSVGSVALGGRAAG